MQYYCYLLSTLFVGFISISLAFPNGAPVCNIGAANVQEQHLQVERSPKTGTNEFGRYQTILGGSTMVTSPTDPTFVNLFQFGVENTLIIQSGAGSYLKGLLVIASGGITENINSLDTKTPEALTITDTERTKVADGCADFSVSSVTHTSAVEKRNVAMKFKWPTNGGKLYLDVNIVKTNNDTAGSEYYFTQYPLQASQTCEAADTNCGLLGLRIFCPLTSCGIFGRILGLCDESAGC